MKMWFNQTFIDSDPKIKKKFAMSRYNIQHSSFLKLHKKKHRKIAKGMLYIFKNNMHLSKMIINYRIS